MQDYDLEIGLHRWDNNNYSVDLRFSQPDSEAEERLMPGGLALLQFDLENLAKLALTNDPAYGQMLSDTLFAPVVREAFHVARSKAQGEERPLRLRLFIGPSAEELHTLRWETLCDPLANGTLAAPAPALLTNANLLFSRYLTSLDWRPVRSRSQGQLKVLAVIANPTNLHTLRPGGRVLPPVDVEGEAQRLAQSLDGLPLTVLRSGKATLDELIHNLREASGDEDDGYDVLYMVCHGALIRGEPRLYLEDETGQADVVAGSELVGRIRELQQQPRLVVLASCQSMGKEGAPQTTTDGGVLSAVGPRLAQAGIPAVIAMQGDISQPTIEKFMPVFFAQLVKDGPIDQAMALARGAVRDFPDHWAPTLFMRLRNGRLSSGGLQNRVSFDKWDALLNNIRQNRCTPILGSGLVEPLLGSTREIARRWAESNHYPMSADDREDLPQIAQYLAINQDTNYPRDALVDDFLHEITRRYELSDEVAMMNDPNRNAREKLNQAIAAVGRQLRASNLDEPHRVLSKLPCPIYLTTNQDNLLHNALQEAEKTPQVELCRWKEEVEWPESFFHPAPGEPAPVWSRSVQKPLVYHLFGDLHPDRGNSLVLTEDDFFDYLISVSRNKDLVPSVVRSALVNSALLFLGFHLDDWNFRVLFRSLVSQEGRGKRGSFAHVAVQIDPTDGRIVEPERARRYLERYFQSADVSIYWGSVEDFMKELRQRWRQKYGQDL